MSFHRLFCILLAMGIIIASSCGCTSREKSLIIVGQDTIIYKKTIDHPGVDVSEVLTGFPSMEDLQEKVGDIYIKKLNEMYYTVIMMSGQRYLVLFGANKAVNGGFAPINFSDPAAKDKLLQLSSGDSLSVVRKADPQGYYGFIYASSKDWPQNSFHFFEDGSAFWIHYSEDIITSIISFTI